MFLYTFDTMTTKRIAMVAIRRHTTIAIRVLPALNCIPELNCETFQVITIKLAAIHFSLTNRLLKSHFVMASFSPNRPFLLMHSGFLCANSGTQYTSIAIVGFTQFALSVYRLLIFHYLSLHGFCLQMIFQGIFPTIYPTISFTLGILFFSPPNGWEN